MQRKNRSSEKISVVIPAYNSESVIEKTLKAVLSQTVKPEEVIVVDDGSTDQTKKIVEKYPIRYIYQKNKGPASARNTGWKKAIGDIVIFTDSDCVPMETWIEKLTFPFLQKGSQLAAVGGAYKTANSKNLIAKSIGAEIDFRYSRLKKYIDAHGSYNLAVRKKILQKIGGFDERYPTPSGEDWDLCYKIIQQGGKIIFAPKAIVKGFHREKLMRYFRDQFRHGYYRARLYRSHPQMLVKGDQYSRGASLAVGLSLLIVFSLINLVILRFILKRLSFFFGLILIISLLLLLFANTKLFIFIKKKHGIKLSFLVLFIQMIRSFAWTLGLFVGGMELLLFNRANNDKN